jgi:hypothetical protein
MPKLFLLFYFFLLNTSLAQVPLPPLREPSELVTNAQKGRYDFMDSIYEIRNSAMERRPIQQNIDYQFILPQLKKIELDLKFPEFGVSPTDDLGEFITACLAPRFQLDDLEATDMEIFVKFSKEETLFSAIGNQIQYLNIKPRSEIEWKALFDKSDLLSKLIINKPKVSKLLIDTSYGLQGHILSQYLFLYYKEINLDLFLLSVQQIQTTDNLERILKFTSSEWKKIAEPSLKLKLFKMALTASIQLRTIHDDSSLSVLHIIGETLLAQIKDLIRYELELDQTLLQASTSFFIQRDWQELADILISLKPDEMFPVHYNNYLFLTNISLGNPQLWLFPEQLKKLKDFSKKLNLGTIGGSRLSEGYYLTSDQKYFWLISSTPWQSEIKLINKWGDLYQSFPIPNFDLTSKQLIYFSKTNDGQINTQSSHLEFDRVDSSSNKAVYRTNHGAIPFTYTLIKNFPELNLSSPASGKYFGLVKKSPINIELSQISYSSWKATLKFSQNNTSLDFYTQSACLQTSPSCDFQAETNTEDEWAFMRLGLTETQEIQGFLIQGNTLTNFLLGKE